MFARKHMLRWLTTAYRQPDPLPNSAKICPTKPNHLTLPTERASVTDPHFDEAAWIERLAVALEAIAASARPSYSPLPPETMRPRTYDEYLSSLRRGYRSLAARAKHDSTAASQFEDSHLLLDTDPAEARDILREHPLMKPGLVGSGKREGVGFTILDTWRRSGLSGLVLGLARLSVKEGGEEAAGRLHRFLTAGANARVPAYEITVFHGLVVATRFDLGHGAYVAPYEHARVEFDLPDEPEPLAKTSYPNAAVLVRRLGYGPGVAPLDDEPGLHHVQVVYDFPTDYRIDGERWPYDSRLLVDLLSIAARSPLLARTSYVRLDKWIGEIARNLALGTLRSAGYVSDVWPIDRDLSKSDIDIFAALSRGWCTYAGKSDAMNLAIRRLAASFSRPGGWFGVEDRILDVAIALEVLYGDTGSKFSPRAAALLAATSAEQMRIYDQARRFYKVRSGIVHPTEPTPTTDVLELELQAGRDLACRTLVSLLNREAPVPWADVMRNLLPETHAHINASRHQNDE